MTGPEIADLLRKGIEDETEKVNGRGVVALYLPPSRSIRIVRSERHSKRPTEGVCTAAA